MIQELDEYSFENIDIQRLAGSINEVIQYCNQDEKNKLAAQKILNRQQQFEETH